MYEVEAAAVVVAIRQGKKEEREKTRVNAHFFFSCVAANNYYDDVCLSLLMTLTEKAFFRMRSCRAFLKKNVRTHMREEKKGCSSQP